MKPEGYKLKLTTLWNEEFVITFNEKSIKELTKNFILENNQEWSTSIKAIKQHLIKIKEINSSRNQKNLLLRHLHSHGLTSTKPWLDISPMGRNFNFEDKPNSSKEDLVSFNLFFIFFIIWVLPLSLYSNPSIFNVPLSSIVLSSITLGYPSFILVFYLVNYIGVGYIKSGLLYNPLEEKWRGNNDVVLKTKVKGIRTVLITEKDRVRIKRQKRIDYLSAMAGGLDEMPVYSYDELALVTEDRVLLRFANEIGRNQREIIVNWFNLLQEENNYEK